MRIIFLLAVMCWCSIASAQYKTVMFNYEKSFFNEGQPLPSENRFMLNGEITSEIQMVEVEIFKNKKIGGTPVFTTLWKRPDKNQENSFSLPVNIELIGGSNYSLVINYFEPASTVQRDKLNALLEEVLFQYLEQSVQIRKTNIVLLKNPKLIMKEMNQIVKTSLAYYENKNNFRFNGFSDIILSQLQQLEKLNLKHAVYYDSTEADMGKSSTRVAYANKQVDGVKQLVAREITQFIDSYLMIMTDTKVVLDYPTEKVKYTIAVNAGYAGAYNDGNAESFTYGSGVTVGLSFPLGRGTSKSGLNRLAISTGVFVSNFEFENGEGASGPLVKRPFYLGLGVKALKVVRISAGAVALQSTDSNKVVDFGKVYIRPYIGISIELNLWLGF